MVTGPETKKKLERKSGHTFTHSKIASLVAKEAKLKMKRIYDDPNMEAEIED